MAFAHCATVAAAGAMPTGIRHVRRLIVVSGRRHRRRGEEEDPALLIALVLLADFVGDGEVGVVGENVDFDGWRVAITGCGWPGRVGARGGRDA